MSDDISVSSFESKTSNSNSFIQENVPTVKFLHFNDFKVFPEIPAYADCSQYLVSKENIDRENALIIFVSHKWLRSTKDAPDWTGYPLPDTPENHIHRLCISGIEEIQKTMAPGMTDTFIWIDYSCLSHSISSENCEDFPLEKIFEFCDCMLSPLHDPSDTDYVGCKSTDPIRWSKSTSWVGNSQSYLSRGWCRLEMFYNSSIPILPDSQERLAKLARDLLFRHKISKRPHIVYQTRDYENYSTPTVLDPLSNATLEEFNPTDGLVSNSIDTVTIKLLVSRLLNWMKPLVVGYNGERKPGKGLSKRAALGVPHGKGVYIFSNGDIYEGEWKDGKMSGIGTYSFANGDVYVGSMDFDVMHGNGHFKYINGDQYLGVYVQGKKHDKNGKYIFSDGMTYEGGFKNDQMFGFARLTYADGAIYIGECRKGHRHGTGKYMTPEGETYDGIWKNDQQHGVFTVSSIAEDGKTPITMTQFWQEGLLIRRK